MEPDPKQIFVVRKLIFSWEAPSVGEMQSFGWISGEFLIKWNIVRSRKFKQKFLSDIEWCSLPLKSKKQSRCVLCRRVRIRTVRWMVLFPLLALITPLCLLEIIACFLFVQKLSEKWANAIYADCVYELRWWNLIGSIRTLDYTMRSMNTNKYHIEQTKNHWT